MRDGIFEEMTSTATFPASGITIDNNHFETGTARGTNPGSGDVTFDVNYRPTAGLTHTIAVPKLLWDYHGNSLANDGTDLVGAAQVEPAINETGMAALWPLKHRPKSPTIRQATPSCRSSSSG